MTDTRADAIVARFNVRWHDGNAEDGYPPWQMAKDIETALTEAQARVTARLRDPDAALVEAVMVSLFGKFDARANYQTWVPTNRGETKAKIRRSLRALADALDTAAPPDTALAEADGRDGKDEDQG